MATKYIIVPHRDTGSEENMGNIKHDIKPGLKMSDMSSSLERLASFRTWPDDVLTSAVDLTDCGFYYTGYKDEVICCNCGVRLKDWKDDDSPYERHIAESPHCQYLALRLMQHKHSVRDTANKHKHKKMEKTKTVTSNTDALNIISNQISTGVPNTDWYIPRQEHPSKYVDYSVEANRYASFMGHWPVDSPMNPTEMVQAGLYYVGPNDRVQCAWCRGHMYNWEVDDSPMSEHSRHFPKCPFIISKMHEKINFPTQTRMLSQQVSTKSNDIQDMPAVYIVKEMGYELDIIKNALEKWRSNSSSSTSEGNISATKLLDYIFEIENEVSEDSLDVDSEATSISNTPKDNTNKSSLYASKLQPLLSEKLDNDDFEQKLKHENETLKGKSVCKICLDNEVDMLLLPCRHLVCCSRCGDAVTQCPMCRTVIIGTVNTSLPHNI